MRVGIIGINHKLADLKLREMLAKACQKRFGAGSSIHGIHQFVLLSTCNRTEVYFTSDDLSVTHTHILSILRNEVPEEFEHKLYSFFGKDCFSHLSRVIVGLDSAIVAETEIQRQVKLAYEAAAQYTSLSSDLHYLFQKALKIGKQVRSDLQLGRGMPDLEHAILQIGSHMFPQINMSKVLFVGVSEINQKILHFFQAKGMKDITLCNRSQHAAKAFASEHQLKTLAWPQLNLWHQYDWIIFGTKSPDYLLTKANLEKTQISQKLVIDLCVPRNVEPSLGKEPGITLLNIDQINRTLKIRKRHMNHAISVAEDMISKATHRQVSLFTEKEKSRQRYLAVGA